ncbi:MAG: hypothetical protein NZZ41_07205 [Candidatus Dojkabacteria bacterium]|nr:hypothetical protein [Candidatus Dojkabacteria bacterium]
MNWQTKYITDENSISLYNEHMVKEIKSFFENVVKKRIKEVRTEDQQFNKVIL